jgi:hypothetical protein
MNINCYIDKNIFLDVWLEKDLPTSLTNTQCDLISFIIEYLFVMFILLNVEFYLTKNKYALLCTWKSWSVIPQMIYASGVGVYAALCANDIINIKNNNSFIIALIFFDYNKCN